MISFMGAVLHGEDDIKNILCYVRNDEKEYIVWRNVRIDGQARYYIMEKFHGFWIVADILFYRRKYLAIKKLLRML